MTRAGLNCTLGYARGGTRHTYKVRAGDLSFGTQMVAAEDVARIHRSYYPHKTANQQFSVQILLKDWTERAHLTNWLSDYAQWALDPNIVRTQYPYLTVSVPRRDFYQRGVPLQGYEWGAHTGMMMFSPVFLFEAAFGPSQQDPTPPVSTVINKWTAFRSDKAIQYFYPFGTQLQGTRVPQSYTHVIPPAGSVPDPGTPVVPTPPPPLRGGGPVPPGAGEF
jgi:hypothetical protein